MLSPLAKSSCAAPTVPRSYSSRAAGFVLTDALHVPWNDSRHLDGRLDTVLTRMSCCIISRLADRVSDQLGPQEPSVQDEKKKPILCVLRGDSNDLGNEQCMFISAGERGERPIYQAPDLLQAGL